MTMTARSKRIAQGSLIAVVVLALMPVGAAHAGRFGHGVGMSQYGAQGYAVHGYSAARILAHYYLGTRLAQVSTRTRVRVLLAPAQASVSVGACSALTVTDGRGRSLKLPAGSYRIDGSLRIAGPEQDLVPAPPLRLEARRGFLTFDGSPYRGALVLERVGAGVSVVNALGVDDYVRGVVAYEMPSSWAPAALGAQAVAARSYVLAERRPDRAFDVYPDTRSQMYGGVRAETAPTDAAVAATSGHVLMWHGRIATTYYSAASGGRTVAVQDAWPGARPVPYLRSVADPYGIGVGWVSTVSRMQLETRPGLHHVDGSRQAMNRSGRLVSLDVRSGETTPDVATTPSRPARPRQADLTLGPFSGLVFALLGVLCVELLRATRRRTVRPPHAVALVPRGRAYVLIGLLAVVWLLILPLGSGTSRRAEQPAVLAELGAPVVTRPAVPLRAPRDGGRSVRSGADAERVTANSAGHAHETVRHSSGKPIPAPVCAPPQGTLVARRTPTPTRSQRPSSPTASTTPPREPKPLRPAGPLEISHVRVVTVTPTASVVKWRTSLPSMGMGAVGAPSSTLFTPPDKRATTRHATAFAGLQSAAVSHLRLRAHDRWGRSKTATVDVTTPAASTAEAPAVAGDAIELGGQPYFPLMVRAACAEEARRELDAGINLFYGNGCGSDGALLNALRGRAFAATDGYHENAAQPGLIGWFYPDGWDVHLASNLASDEIRALGPQPKPGLLSFLTLTDQFYSKATPLPRGNPIYPTLARIPDVVGFDVSPPAQSCRDSEYGDVYNAQRELERLTGGKPTFQWIHVASGGKCNRGARVPDAADAATVHAKAWLAIAAGADAVGYSPGTWTQAVGAELARTNAQIRELTPALLGKDVEAKATARAVKVGARALNGATYVIAVNATRSPVATTIAVRRLKATAAGVYDEQRRVSVVGGAFRDRFDPLAVHIYVAAPPRWARRVPTPTVGSRVKPGATERQR
ncbi:MAG: stage sporulation protein [Gaiellales bacterium]|nr:stage sporulation protein [Gaiellales bacterium]